MARFAGSQARQRADSVPEWLYAPPIRHSVYADTRRNGENMSAFFAWLHRKSEWRRSASAAQLVEYRAEHVRRFGW